MAGHARGRAVEKTPLTGPGPGKVPLTELRRFSQGGSTSGRTCTMCISGWGCSLIELRKLHHYKNVPSPSPFHSFFSPSPSLASSHLLSIFQHHFLAPEASPPFIVFVFSTNLQFFTTRACGRIQTENSTQYILLIEKARKIQFTPQSFGQRQTKNLDCSDCFQCRESERRYVIHS